MQKVVNTFLLFLSLLFVGIQNTFSAQIGVDDVFSDISKDYKFYNELQTLYDRGMIFPDNNGKFNAKRLLNRDEFVGISMEVTCRNCISPSTDFSFIKDYATASTFYDVKKTNKYFYCIAEADDKGYVKGYDKGYTCENNEVDPLRRPFCVDNKITLEEALAVILRNSGIFTVEENRIVIDQINAGEITEKLADDISPTGINGGAYTFYGYFKEALDFELLEYDENGEQKTYKLLELTGNKARPGQSISKEDFLRIAYIALKANSCVQKEENELAINIEKLNKQCNITDQNCTNKDFLKNENIFDFSADVSGVCELGVNKVNGYTWKFYNVGTGDEVIKKERYLDNYKFLKAGKWRVSLHVRDECGKSGEIYLTQIVNGERDDNKDSSDSLGLEIETLPLIAGIKTKREFKCLVSGGSGNYICKWDFGDGTNAEGIGVSHTYKNPGTYIVKVITKDSEGKEAEAKVTIVVIDDENINELAADIQATPKYGKIGMNVSFEGIAYGGTGNYRYLWDYGDNTKGKGKNATHIYSSEGNYLVKLTVIDSKGHRASSTMTIVVIQKDGTDDTGSLGVDIKATPLDGGTDTIRNFDALVEGGNGDYTYDWDFGDSTDGTGESIEHLYNEPGIYVATLTVTDGEGNTGISSTTITATENINELAADIQATPKYGKIGMNVSFEGIAYGGTGNYRYLWDYGDNTKGKGKNATHIYSSEGNYLVKLTVIDSKGHRASSTMTIVVIQKDGTDDTGSLGVDIKATPLDGGTDTIRNFDALVEGGNGDYTYDWDFGDSTDGTGESIEHLYNEPGIYVATLTVTDGEGNTGTSTVNVMVTESEGEMAVGIKVLPSTTSFIGERMSFVSKVEGGDKKYIYKWNFNDGSDSAYQNPEHIYKKEGSYIVNLEVEDGTGKVETAQASVLVKKTESILDGINVSIERNPAVGNLGMNVLFNSDVSNGGPEYIYDWDFGDGNTGSQKNPQHIYNTIGTHTITLSVRDLIGRTGQVTTTVIVFDESICVEGTDTDNDGITDCDTLDKCPLIPGSELNQGCPILEQTCNADCSCQDGYKCTSVDPLQCGTIGLCTPKREVLNACLEYGQNSLIYGNVSSCNSCPCLQSLDFNSNLRKCDLIFPAITSPDFSKIYSRGEIFNVR